MLVAPHVKRKFFALCDRSGGPNACHPWVGGKPDPTSGYGQVNWIELGGKQRVHVVAWELANDQEVPRHPDTGRKLDVDHLCHNRAKRCPGGKLCKHRLCCNPRHLAPKTRQENLDAADEPRARGRFRTHFDCGCAITPENTYLITRKGTRNGRPRKPERRCKTHERKKQQAAKVP